MNALEQGPPEWMVDAAERFYHLDKSRDVAWLQIERREIALRDLNECRFLVDCPHDTTRVTLIAGVVADPRRSAPVFLGQCPTCKTIFWGQGVWKR